MIIDMGSVEALCAAFGWKAEKSWLSAWLAALLELALVGAALEVEVELESLAVLG